MKLRNKITLYFSLVMFVLLIPILFFYTKKNVESSREKVILESNSFNQKSALMINRYFQSNLEKVRMVSVLFNKLSTYTEEVHRDLIIQLSKDILQENNEVAGFWYNRQIKYLDSTWHSNNGRFEIKYYRSNNQFVYKETIADKEIEGEEYKKIRLRNTEVIYPPYIGSYTGLKEHENMYINVASPLKIEGVFAGLVGMDFDLDQIAAYFDEINPFDEGFSVLLHSQGNFVYHAESNYRAKNYIDYFSTGKMFDAFENHFKKAESCSGTFVNKEGVEFYCSFIPIKPAHSEDYLYFGSFVPREVIVSESKALLIKTIFFGLLGIILMAFIIYFIGNKLANPIIRITQLLQKLAEGNINENLKIEINSGDELEEMTNSANELIDGLGKTAQFARQIGEGDLQASYEKNSREDILGAALLEMRESLLNAKEAEDKRKVEDDKQNWATQGQARFGDILRQNNSDIENLSFDIMKNLVDYVNAIQGGLFVKDEHEDREIRFNLTGAIAYNRQKLMDSSFAIGESLIGRCAYEKLTIYMEDVPDNYVNITSGLGESNPRSILIVPAILNDEVYAIIELVSFEKFEAYQIEFVEKIGESIASTISNAKTNDQTNKLLEQSKLQAEELAAQEEEMRQNLEELQATQEELNRVRKEDMEKNRKIVAEKDQIIEQLKSELDDLK